MSLDEIRRLIAERTVPERNCLMWQGAADGDGVPRLRLASGRTTGVRRALLIAKGVDMEGKLATNTCGNAACVCEQHAVAWTRKRLVSRAAKKQTGNVALSMKRAINGRKHGKLSMEQVREMRASGMKARQAAATYSITLRTAQKVLNGDSWKEYGSPFAGLGAGNDNRSAA